MPETNASPSRTADLYIDELDELDEVASYQHASLGFAISDINIKTEQQSGHFLLDMLRHGEINLDTPFQRSADLWKNAVMSRFIESMMLKFPIPPFYFNIAYRNGDASKPFWEVIDGLQRLSAIRKFFHGDSKGKFLRLEGLDFFPELNGKTIEELPRHLTRNIESCQLTLFEVFPNTPKIVKYRIFERVNTGGLKLNEQEIRHALNQGRPVEVVSRAVQECLVANGINIDPGRMKDQELALRYIAFQLIPLSDFGESMKDFLDRAMEKIESLSHSQVEELIFNFRESIRFILDVFGKISFRKDEARGINKALFDSFTFAATGLTSIEKRLISTNIDKARSLYRLSFQNESFMNSITYATARSENIRKRFDYAAELFGKVLHDR